jgi:hypothetical protein
MAALMAIIGFAILVYGLQLSNASPRTNELDDFVWRVFALGSAVTGAGISLPFIRNALVPLVALALPPIVFALLVGLIWGSLIFRAMIGL